MLSRRGFLIGANGLLTAAFVDESRKISRDLIERETGKTVGVFSVEIEEVR